MSESLAGAALRRPDTVDAISDTQRLVVISLLLMAALGEATYWTTFFATDAMRFPGVSCFRVFDLAFPAANLWTTVTALIAAHGLWRRSATAVLFGVICGSSLIYLGLVDLAFFLGNGMYSQPDPAIYGEIAIHASCFTLAPGVVWWLWTNRRALGV